MSSQYFSHYLTDINTTPLLKAKEEIQLGIAVQLGLQTVLMPEEKARIEQDIIRARERIEAKLGLAEIDPEKLAEARKKVTDLEQHLQERLGARNATPDEIKAGQEAQTLLVQSNLKLVVSIANKVQYTSQLSVEELTFEGNQGLMTAAGRYNPTKFQTRFSTYATFWIREAMRQAVHHSHTIRTPIRRALDYNKIRQAISFEEDRAEQDYGKLETETGLTQDQIDRILNNRCTTISLSATACEDSEVTLGDTLSNGDDSPAEGYMVTEEHRLMREKLCILGKQEQDIIRARFGIGQEHETLEVIAKRHNISRERIRQIEKCGFR